MTHSLSLSRSAYRTFNLLWAAFGMRFNAKTNKKNTLLNTIKNHESWQPSDTEIVLIHPTCANGQEEEEEEEKDKPSLRKVNENTKCVLLYRYTKR